MSRAVARPEIELRGVDEGRAGPAAVAVLEGASAAEVRRARALARRLRRAVRIVAVDGGAHSCRAAGVDVDLWIGDGDSGRAPPGVEALDLERDKDFSDFAGALHELARRRIEVVVVAGLLGGRLDHEWSNLLEAGRQAGHFAAIVAPASRGTVIVSARGCRIGGIARRTVSLFALGAAATLTLRGVRWPLERGRLEPGSRGLSNVVTQTMELEVHDGVAAVALVSQPLTARHRGSSTTP